MLYALIGAAGISGVLTGDAVARFGARHVLLTSLGSLSPAAFLLGIAPSSWIAIALSASLHGTGVMVMSTLDGFFSLEGACLMEGGITLLTAFGQPKSL